MLLTINYFFIFSFFLFFLGLLILLIHKNLIFILISLEIMINTILLSMVVLSHYWNQIDGQIMCILIITIAASEISIGLIFLLRIYQRYKTLDIYLLSEMSQ